MELDGRGVINACAPAVLSLKQFSIIYIIYNCSNCLWHQPKFFMNYVTQDYLTSSDCFLVCHAWNVPQPSGCGFRLFALQNLKFASALHDSWNTEKSNLSSLSFSVRWCVWTSLTLCWTSSWWMPLKTWRAHPHLWWLCWGIAGSPTALKRRLINCTWTHCTVLYTFCVANERTVCFYFFKALATACWSVLKAKRRLLMVSWLAITCWKCCQASIYLTPQFVSLHRFPTASSPTSMPYQKMLAQF